MAIWSHVGLVREPFRLIAVPVVWLIGEPVGFVREPVGFVREPVGFVREPVGLIR